MKRAKIFIVLSTISIFIICAIVSIMFFTNAQIKDYRAQLNDIYSNFTKAEEISDKDKIFNEFIKTTDGNKFSKVEESYNKILSDMKAEISNEIEREIENFNNFDFENKTKSELKSEIETLNNFAEKIESFKKSVSSKNSEKYQKQINKLISSYENKINEIKEKEKEEKEKIEAEKAAKEKAEKEARKNNVSSYSETDSTKNKTTQNQATHKKHIDITNPNEYVEHYWMHNDGVKIEKSDEYKDIYGNIYNYKGDFMYNLDEWLDVVE